MPNILKNVLRYPGGKVKAIRQIINFMPDYFSEYREPFLGGGPLFIYTKQMLNPKAKYVLNDINYDLICFWKKVRDDPIRMMNAIYSYKRKYKIGRELYNDLIYKNHIDDFERGVRFFILNRITFSGLIDSGGFSQEAFEKRFTYSSISRLEALSKILQDVSINNYDYSLFLGNEGEDVFLYLDPPYFDFKKSKLYGNQGSLHTGFELEKFVNIVSKCKHKWLISYSYSEEIVNSFKNNYNVYKIKLSYGMRNTGSQNINSNEVLITNYEPFNSAIKSFKIN